MRSFGPNPWQQTHWDWRAAANFICGGAGAGMIALTPFTGAQGVLRVIALLLGLALVGFGLFCVWTEIGRPLRALNVFFNPRTSWVTREALIATLLLPVTLTATAGGVVTAWLAAALALAFVYCQGRILLAARAIPSWREPMIVPLIVLTGLAEGAGLWLLAEPLQIAGSGATLTFLAALVLARSLLWPFYRSRLAAVAAVPALAALDSAGRWLLWLGAVLPLTLLTLVASGLLTPPFVVALLACAGVTIIATGAWFKFVLITRAGFNQGFALVHLPVRGVPR